MSWDWVYSIAAVLLTLMGFAVGYVVGYRARDRKWK